MVSILICSALSRGLECQPRCLNFRLRGLAYSHVVTSAIKLRMYRILFSAVSHVHINYCIYTCARSKIRIFLLSSILRPNYTKFRYLISQVNHEHNKQIQNWKNNTVINCGINHFTESNRKLGYFPKGQDFFFVWNGSLYIVHFETCERGLKVIGFGITNRVDLTQ